MKEKSGSQTTRFPKGRAGKVPVRFVLGWALLASCQAVAYTSESYVRQDHLVAQWDGIDNAGVGRHDPQATVWKDLKGNLDMTLTAKGSWTALGNALYVSGVGAQAKSAAPAYKTIEIVYRMTKDGGRLMFCSGTTARWVVLDPSSGSPKHIYFAAGVTTPRIEWPLDTTNIHSVAATYSDDTVSGVFLNGATPTTDTGKNGWGTGDGKVAVGGRKFTESKYDWTGEIYAIRLYDIVLTAEEIAANKAIDDARFVRSMVSRYVQDGLVAHWDGVDNAGTGVHDPSATVRKDLKGNLDLTLTNNASWNALGNGLVVSNLSAIGTDAAPKYQTIEVVYRCTRNDGRILFNSGDNARFVLFDHWDGNRDFIYFSSSGAKLDGSVTNTLGVVRTRDFNEVCCLAARYDETNVVTDITCDGASVNGRYSKNGWSPDNRAMIGNRAVTNPVYPWYGEVYAIRLYNRRLTRAELAENNRIDRLRFFSTANYRGREALLSHWDGANNFGAGVDYNPQASAWKDLVGPRDLVLTTNGSWSVTGNNGLVVNGASATNVPPPAYKTIEVAYRHTSLPKVDDKYQSQILFNSGNSGTQIVCYMQMGTLVYFSGKSAAHQMVKWASFDTSAIRSLAATYTNAAATAEFVYGDGVRRSDATQNHSWSSCWARMIIGDNLFGASASVYRPWYGEVYALRLYDRALTDEEIAFNAALDKKRIALTPKTVTWAGGDGDFGTAANWAGGALPHFNDAVVIASGMVASREDQIVGSLALGAEAALALKVTGEAVPLTVTRALTAETGAGLVLDATAFGKKHPQESVTLVSCGSASAAALETLAANVSFGTTPVSRRGTLAVSSDGTRLVYTAPTKPGIAVLVR